MLVKCFSSLTSQETWQMSEGTPAAFNIGDLTKPITKLIEVVSGAGYILYEPTRIRKLARAEAEAAQIKAKSDATVARIETGADTEAAKRRAEVDAEIAVLLGKSEIH